MISIQLRGKARKAGWDLVREEFIAQPRNINMAVAVEYNEVSFEHTMWVNDLSVTRYRDCTLAAV